jgi:hypothetical protein
VRVSWAAELLPIEEEPALRQVFCLHLDLKAF